MDPRAYLIRVLNGAAAGATFPLAEGSGELHIGRSPECDIVLPDSHISGKHAAIRLLDGEVQMRDLGSTHGTRVIDEEPPAILEDWRSITTPARCTVGYLASQILLTIEPEELEEPAFGQVLAQTTIERLDELESRANPQLLKHLLQAQRCIMQPRELGDVLSTAVNKLFELFPTANRVSLYLEGERISGRAAHPEALITVNRDGSPAEPEAASRWLWAKVRDERTAMLLGNADINSSSSLNGRDIRALLVSPLWVGERVVGMALVEEHAGLSPTMHSASLGARGDCTPSGSLQGTRSERLTGLALIASSLSLAIDNARLTQRLAKRQKRLDDANEFLLAREARDTSQMIGESPAMKDLRDKIERVKDLPVPVLVFGETGTGKELVARSIHFGSKRSKQLFVAQNCAAFPEDLLESELFGHVKGAFTGATSDKKGLFEIAHGGTVFLDEIGETSAAVQAKLLRVLQEGEVRPVGAPQIKKVDVRVVSATNRDLEEEVAAGRFREDLFYRLNVFPINIPPLRDRIEDIRLLASYFMERYAADFSCAPLHITPKALQLLQTYSWPGNIRELQNEIQRLLISRTHPDWVHPDDLSPRIRKVNTNLLAVNDDKEKPLKERMAAIEQHILLEALREHEGNKTQTAKALGITREGLHKKLNRFGIS